MKEEDAKKKVCPINSSYSAVGNVAKSTINKCIGSECMMWEADVVAEDIEIEVEHTGTMMADNVNKWQAQAGHGYKFLRKSVKSAKKIGFIIIELRRYVDSNTGDCGLKSKELYCEGCNN